MPKLDYSQLRTIPVPMSVLVTNKLSPSQWVAMYLIHFELYAELAAYLEAENSPQGFDEDELEDLHKRGFILFRPVPGNHAKTSSRNMKISELFTRLLPHTPAPVTLAAPRLTIGSVRLQAVQAVAEVALDELEAFDELFLAYPSHLNINGTLMSGRGGDYDSMAASYGKALLSKSTPAHSAILELVRWAKDNQLLTMGLLKFLSSREWLGLQELRDQGFAGGTFDSQTAI